MARKSAWPPERRRRAAGPAGLSLVELLVATTIFAIVALAAGGIFGKFYYLFGRTSSTVRAQRVANELINRYQARWRHDFGQAPASCPDLERFCYQADLYRDTGTGGNPQALADLLEDGQVRPAIKQLQDYTAFIDVRPVVPRTPAGTRRNSDWLRAKTISVRIFKASDVFCGSELVGVNAYGQGTGNLDELGLPKLLHPPEGNLAGDYYVRRSLKATVTQSYFAQTATCAGPNRGQPTVLPAPLAESALTLVANPRTLVSRTGLEFISYRPEGSNAPYLLQPPGALTEDRSPIITYFDAARGANVTVDLYRGLYPSLLHVPPVGWVPDATGATITFDPEVAGADPTIRFVIWTFAGPDAPTNSPYQFRHRLGITTFTSRAVSKAASDARKFLLAPPQAAGHATDNYLPLAVSITSLPDKQGQCVDELVSAANQAITLAACTLGDSSDQFTRIVLPVFPSNAQAAYEASVNVPPGPPLLTEPAAAGLPNVLGLPAIITTAEASDPQNPLARYSYSSPAAPVYGRPHLVHVTVPKSQLLAWTGAGQQLPLHLSIARVRFIN